MNLMRKKIRQQQEARAARRVHFEANEKGGETMWDLKDEIEQIKVQAARLNSYKREAPNRELALAITKLEEAKHWLQELL